MRAHNVLVAKLIKSILSLLVLHASTDPLNEIKIITHERLEPAGDCLKQSKVIISAALKHLYNQQGMNTGLLSY